MKFIITEEDINNAIPRTKICPIYLSAKRTLPEIKNIRVGISVIYLNEIRYALPNNAIVFIFDFDHLIPVSPFEFDLEEKLD